MRHGRFVLIGMIGLLLACGVRAELAVGATREQVEAVYGKPTGSTQIGTREVLSYGDGRVYLDKGRLVKVDVPDVAAPKKDSVTSAPAKVSSEAKSHRSTSTVPNMHEGWYTDFDQARDAAKEQHKNILALFTGSDWCPPCMRFEREVAHDPKFLRAAREKFVLVILDYPHETPQPEAVRQKNEELSRRYKIEGYPTLLAINADRMNSKLVALGMPPVDDLLQSMVTLVEKTDSVSPSNSRLQLLGLISAGLIAVFWWLKR